MSRFAKRRARRKGDDDVLEGVFNTEGERRGMLEQHGVVGLVHVAPS